MILNSKTKLGIAAATLVVCGILAFNWFGPTDVVLTPDVVAPGEAVSLVPRLESTTESVANPEPLASQACAPCHAELVASYARSGMSRTWRAVDQPAVAELSGASAEVVDRVSGYQYQISVAPAEIRQIETHGDHPDHRLTVVADYLVGSGKHAVAAVASENGYLTQLPAAWFRHDRAWRMNPGFELHNHRFERPITPACVACHGGDAVHESPTANRFDEPIGGGIRCQRCHGPSRPHVSFWSTSEPDDAAEEPITRPLPAGTVGPPHDGQTATLHMTAAEKNDLCLQCHLQGDVTVYPPGQTVGQFQPGDRLRDHRHDFLVDAGEPAALGVASHGARMLRSRCFLESDGALTCLHCHDPHRPSNDLDSAFYNTRCATCHATDDCQRVETRAAVGETSCVACHMPQRSSQEGIHLVFTDHAIPRATLAVEQRDWTATTLAPNTQRIRLVSAWPDDEADPTTRGAAYVQLHETMGPQIPALEFAVKILPDAVRQNPHDPESRFWLGSALAALGRGREAIPLLEQVVARQPERHLARFRLGVACELAGDFPQAMRHYRQLVDQAPGWVEPYARLADLYLARQQPNLAVPLLRQQLSYQQSAAALTHLALAERMTGGGHEAALDRVTAALRLDPRLPAAYIHRAALQLLVGEEDRAKEDFQRVLRLDPTNQQARQALQNLAAEAAP